jgi:hypothetical protein
MKKTKLFLSTICFLLTFPILARSERFLDVYGGESTTQNANVSAEVTRYSILGSLSQSQTERMDLDSSFTMGGRLGYWFEKLPWPGVSLDWPTSKKSEFFPPFHSLCLTLPS